MNNEGGSIDAAFVDANVIVRYFMQDVREVVDAVRQIIDEHPQLLITEGTIAEVGYVLTRRYNVPRAIIVDTLIDLIQRSNISIYNLDTDIVIQALMLCRPSGRVSFAAAMLWASARVAGANATVYTFDRRFPSIGIAVRSELPNTASSG